MKQIILDECNRCFVRCIQYIFGSCICHSCCTSLLPAIHMKASCVHCLLPQAPTCHVYHVNSPEFPDHRHKLGKAMYIRNEDFGAYSKITCLDD